MDINGQQSTYQLSYDALGRCVARVLTNPSGSMTSYYIYDGEKPVLEYQSSYLLWTAPSAANIYGRGIDEILQRTDYAAGRTLYYQDDHEGSITHLTMQVNNTPTVVESYRYDAFGKPTINGGALTASAFGNRFMFTGREYVSQFGVYEYRNRAYHPGLGRFMSEDPKGFGAGDNNFFRYCGNDPLDRTDPMGLYEIMPGFPEQQKKAIEIAQPKAAASAEKTAEKIDKALAGGEKSKEFQQVKKTFEKITGKGSGTVEHMQRASQLAKQVAHALRDNGKDGYKIFPESRGRWGEFGHGDVNGHFVAINVDRAFTDKTYSIQWTITHEPLHNVGVGEGVCNGDCAPKWNTERYNKQTTEQRLDNADNFVDLFEHL